MTTDLPIFPDYQTIEKNYQNGENSLIWVKRIDDIETPITAFAKFGQDKFGSCLFESVEGGENRGRYSIVTSNPDLIFKTEKGIAKFADIDENGSIGSYINIDGNPLEALRGLINKSKIKNIDELPPPVSGLYGYLSYEMIRYFEKLPKNANDPLNLPESVFTRPRLVIVFDGIKHELLLASPIFYDANIDFKTAYNKAINILENAWKLLDSPSKLVAQAKPTKAKQSKKASANQTPEEYMAAVEKAKTYIKAGDIFQVVPSQRFSVDFDKSPLSLYRALRRTNPSPFLFLLQMEGYSIIGSSPEILVRLRDGTVTVRPIAGTRPRGKTPAEDQELAESLLNDPKECAEHLMLLDLGRNDVGRVSIAKTNSNNPEEPIGGIRVTKKFFIERYSHVMHIVSNVEGTLKPELDAMDALMGGFPAGTVSGAPKIRAMEIIAELEPHERGIYSGGVGYFAASGDMDMCIALRTGILKDKKLYVQAGAGVVLDSIASSEHNECLIKSRALINAAEEAETFE